MPLHWTIYHEEGLLEILADGRVSKQEIEDCYFEVVAAGALPYLKIVDLRGVVRDPAATSNILTLAAKAMHYRRTGMLGRAAIIVSSIELEDQVKQYATLSGDEKRISVFRDRAAAESWITATPPR